MKRRLNSLSSFTIVAVALVYSVGAHAEYLSEIALFQRCYAQLTSTRVKKSNPLYIQVMNGQKTAANACLTVLNSASFTANGNETIASQADAQAKNVINTFHRFHASWFTIRDFPVLSSNIRNRDVKNIYDATTPALYFTRALFKPATPVSSAVTTNENLVAYRTDMDPANGADSGYAKTDYFFDPIIKLAPMGEMVGVHSSGAQLLNYPPFAKQPGGSIDLYRNLGGGFLGTNAYLSLNMAEMKDDEYMTDGGVKQHRKWGKNIFNDLFCRDIPVVRESDVIGMVDPKSTIAFRTSTSCTKCHASQDRLASLVRGMKVVTLGDGKSAPGEKVRGGIFPAFYQVTAPPEAKWPLEPDPDYYKRPATGTLFLRSYSGDLIDKPVSSVADLGTKIAETDDYYMCLAKRYYSFFTGINVNTGDLGDTSWNYKLTTGDLYHRDIVIALGKNLKTHQSLTQLISEILNLDNYKKSDFGIRSTGK